MLRIELYSPLLVNLTKWFITGWERQINAYTTHKNVITIECQWLSHLCLSPATSMLRSFINWMVLLRRPMHRCIWNALDWDSIGFVVVERDYVQQISALTSVLLVCVGSSILDWTSTISCWSVSRSAFSSSSFQPLSKQLLAVEVVLPTLASQSVWAANKPIQGFVVFQFMHS